MREGSFSFSNKIGGIPDASFVIFATRIAYRLFCTFSVPFLYKLLSFLKLITIFQVKLALGTGVFTRVGFEDLMFYD